MSGYAYWTVSTTTQKPMNFMEQYGVWNIGDKFRYAGDEYEVVDYAEENEYQNNEMKDRYIEWRG